MSDEAETKSSVVWLFPPKSTAKPEPASNQPADHPSPDEPAQRRVLTPSQIQYFRNQHVRGRELPTDILEAIRPKRKTKAKWQSRRPATFGMYCELLNIDPPLPKTDRGYMPVTRDETKGHDDD
jgi:hypothetical protein